LSGWYSRAGLAQAYATANTPSSQWSSGGDAPMLILQPLRVRDIVLQHLGIRLAART
jgi:hypothetical protein